VTSLFVHELVLEKFFAYFVHSSAGPKILAETKYSGDELLDKNQSIKVRQANK
jgi:hypothetical protein